MTTLTIVTLDPTVPAQLFHRYSNESQPQPCHLAIDLSDGEMTCVYNPEIGGGSVPESVYQGRTRWISIPVLSAAAANQLLTDARPYAERILAGARIEWDGNNNVGRLDADARNAENELADMIVNRFPGDPDDLVTEYAAADWYGQIGDEQAAEELGITDATTDVQLEQIAEEMAGEIRDFGQGVTQPYGCLDYATRLRDDLRDQVRLELETAAVAYESARVVRDDLIRRVHGWGTDSLRDIGKRAQISHTHVNTIAEQAGGAQQKDLVHLLGTGGRSRCGGYHVRAGVKRDRVTCPDCLSQND